MKIKIGLLHTMLCLCLISIVTGTVARGTGELTPITPENAAQVALLVGIHDGNVAGGIPDFDTAELNPDGRRVVLSRGIFRMQSGKALPSPIALWDISDISKAGTIDSLTLLEGQTAPAPDWAFRGDGFVMVSAGRDGKIRFWDGVTGELQQTLDGQTTEVMSVAVNPEGTVLASGGYHFNAAGQYEIDETVKVWDAAVGTMVAELPITDVVALTFSPDGSTLAVSRSTDERGSIIELWDWQGSRLNQTLTGHAYYAAALAFSPDGALLVSASIDDDVRLWEVQTGKPIALQLVNHPQLSNYADNIGAAFSPDGKLIAAGHNSGMLRLWSVDSGEQLANTGVFFSGRAESSVRVVGFTPDGTRLVAVGNRGTYLFGVDSATAALPDCRAVVTASSSVNVRGGPGTTFAVVMTARPNNEMLAAARRNDWYKVRFSGSEGWIHSDLVAVQGNDCASLPAE